MSKQKLCLFSSEMSVFINAGQISSNGYIASGRLISLTRTSITDLPPHKYVPPQTHSTELNTRSPITELARQPQRAIQNG